MKRTKEVNPADAAFQDELALRKAIRASTHKNVRLHECMIVVRNIQADFDRQCRRLDRIARDGGSSGGAANQKQIRRDMLSRQKILNAQWDESHKVKPSRWRAARKWQHKGAEGPEDDHEPTNNPSMVVGGSAHPLLHKAREDYDDGRIPRFMDTIKHSMVSEVPQEERAVLLAMGASGTKDDAEEVPVATYNPPHWTSMLAKEWQVREKKEALQAAEAKQRPQSARCRTEPRPSLSYASTHHAANTEPRGSQTARPSTAHIPFAHGPGTGVRAAPRPSTAAPRKTCRTTMEPTTVEAAEIGAVQASRNLHNSVQHNFEETPIAFHQAGVEDSFAREDASLYHIHVDVPEGTPFGEDKEIVPETPFGGFHPPPKPCFIELAGMRVPASSVVLPKEVLEQQLHERKKINSKSRSSNMNKHTVHMFAHNQVLMCTKSSQPASVFAWCWSRHQILEA